MTLLTVAEVGRRLGVSKATAYRLVQHMIRVEVGGSVRVPEEALARYLAQRTITPWDDSTNAVKRGGRTTKTRPGAASVSHYARPTGSSRKKGSDTPSWLRPIRPRTAKRVR